MLPDNKRLLVALTGEDGIVLVDPKDGAVKGSLQTGKGAHNFWPKGDGRHYFLSNRVEGTVSLIDTKDEPKVVGSVRIPGGPDCMDITPDGKELWVTQRFLRRVAIVDIETAQGRRQRPGRQVAARRLHAEVHGDRHGAARRFARRRRRATPSRARRCAT